MYHICNLNTLKRYKRNQNWWNPIFRTLSFGVYIIVFIEIHVVFRIIFSSVSICVFAFADLTFTLLLKNLLLWPSTFDPIGFFDFKSNSPCAIWHLSWLCSNGVCTLIFLLLVGHKSGLYPWINHIFLRLWVFFPRLSFLEPQQYWKEKMFQLFSFLLSALVLNFWKFDNADLW